MYELKTQRMQMTLHDPLDGFYQGTRFDRSGIWDSLKMDGTELCGRWFLRCDPFLHDTVQGPAEEYSLIPLPEGGLKIGVGVLETGTEPYDRFRLYPVREKGEWRVQQGQDRLCFRNLLPGYYDYRKEIRIEGESSFSIRHDLTSSIPLSCEVYNHNFFTLGKMLSSPTRVLRFAFRPEGTWRSVYSSVAFTADGIRFSRALEEGESVYAGDIHAAGLQQMPYRMSVEEPPFRVEIQGNAPLSRTVFWANHRIACLEPYTPLSAETGGHCTWTIIYNLIHV